MTTSKEWLRHRFYADHDDYRPVKFPPPGPYWCSGYSMSGAYEDGYSIVIAWLPKSASVTDWWPEATEIESTEHGPPEWTDRFPKPEWWNP